MPVREAAIHEPISLGFSCEVKYQLSRRLFLDKFPGGSGFDFRQTLLTPSYGQSSFERHLFDWQITPFDGVLDYLEHDFRGVFERQDLFVNRGEVTHRRHGMRYLHDFHPENGLLDDAVVDRQYPAARAKFEHLAQKFRRLMRQAGPFLYVVRITPSLDQAKRLRALLQRGDPRHEFDLLFLGWEEGVRPPDLRGVARYGWATLYDDKSAGRQWEGNDQAWDDALRPWALAIYGGDRIGRRDEGAAGVA